MKQESTKKKRLIAFVAGVLAVILTVGTIHIVNALKPTPKYTNPFLLEEKRFFFRSLISEQKHVENLSEIIETSCLYEHYEKPNYTIYPVYAFDGCHEFYYIVMEGYNSQLIMYNNDNYYIVKDVNKYYTTLWEHSGVLGNSDYELYFGSPVALGKLCFAYKHKDQDVIYYVDGLISKNSAIQKTINQTNDIDELKLYFVESKKGCEKLKGRYDNLSSKYYIPIAGLSE